MSEPVGRSVSIVRVNVLWFAELADRMNERETVIELPEGVAVRDLRDRVGDQFGHIADLLDRCMVAINGEYAGPERVLKSGDQVAFIPPVSGG
ncbi:MULTISPECIES: molybdopterin converting factor subunit 1 [Kyrpidia]|uniref:Molybdopterin synthase sulfur carrier subunit n=2 Tax=Kyrpidia spormannii TaxID=2055160 RepID=A0A6F9EBN3_9BACL